MATVFLEPIHLWTLALEEAFSRGCTRLILLTLPVRRHCCASQSKRVPSIYQASKKRSIELRLAKTSPMINSSSSWSKTNVLMCTNILEPHCQSHSLWSACTSILRIRLQWQANLLFVFIAFEVRKIILTVGLVSCWLQLPVTFGRNSWARVHSRSRVLLWCP
jgi:hypothetical protein